MCDILRIMVRNEPPSSIGNTLFRAVPVVAVSVLLIVLAVACLLTAALISNNTFWVNSLISLGASFLAAALIAFISDVWLSRQQARTLARELLHNDVLSTLSNKEKERYLVQLLNSRFSLLNDEDFGRQLVDYLVAETHHGVYCHDLNTAFTIRYIERDRFPHLAANSPLLKTCFQLVIKEEVAKICVGSAVRCAVFVNARHLARHFSNRDYDFVWHVDLPDDADFHGKVSDLFAIEGIYVNGQLRQPVIRTDDADEFTFEADISGGFHKDELLTISYHFHTLKAKDFRHVAHGTRFLTKTMTTRVDFDPATKIRSVNTTPQFSGLHKPNPYDFDFATRDVTARGWLLPRSGVTFKFRYDETYR